MGASQSSQKYRPMEAAACSRPFEVHSQAGNLSVLMYRKGLMLLQDKYEEKWASSMVQKLNDEAALCRNEEAQAAKRSLAEAKVTCSMHSICLGSSLLFLRPCITKEVQQGSYVTWKYFMTAWH